MLPQQSLAKEMSRKEMLQPAIYGLHSFSFFPLPAHRLISDSLRGSGRVMTARWIKGEGPSSAGPSPSPPSCLSKLPLVGRSHPPRPIAPYAGLEGRYN
jgi:hypothetical protein